MEIIVITKAGDDSGNFAMADDLWREVSAPVWTGEDMQPGIYEQVSFLALLNYRQRVFTPGEVLVLNDYGREIGYPGRKPSKWDVEYETCASLEEAYQKSQEILRRDLAANNQENQEKGTPQ